MNHRLSSTAALLLIAATTPCVVAQTIDTSRGPVPPQVTGMLPEGSERHPVIEPLERGRFRIGNLVLDRDKREIRFPGTVAVDHGPLEYLICAPHGKLYESLLRGDVSAYHLHLALLLAGAEPHNNLEFQGDPTTPGGDPVEIFVSWYADGEQVTRRAEELLWAPSRNGPMRETSWAFTGSTFNVNGYYLAEIEGSLVAVYNDPGAVLNNPLESGANDESYVSRTGLLPPAGTPIEIILRTAAGNRAER